jgi:hypothetical protein
VEAADDAVRRPAQSPQQIDLTLRVDQELACRIIGDVRHFM